MVVLTTPTRAKLAALSMTARSRHARARRRCRCSPGAAKTCKRRSMAADATSLLGSAAARSRGWVDAGLSIVVPLFNEANNLAALHARILEVARALKAGRALATEVVYG